MGCDYVNMSSNLYQRATRGVVWFGGSRVVIHAISWGISIAVARVLSPSDYGLFGMALLYIGLIEFLNDMGLGAAIVQRKDITDTQLHSLFWFTNAIGICFYGFTLLAAPFMARFFHQPLLTHLLWFIGLNHVVTSVQQVPWNILTRAVNFKARSISEASGNLLSGLLAITLACQGWGVWALAWGFLARSILITFLVCLQTRWRPKAVFSWPALRPLLGFSMTVTVARVFYYANNNSPGLIIAKLIGGQALGYYSMAMRLTSDVGERMLTVINQVAFPVYSEIQDQPDRFRRLFLTSTKMTCALVFPLLGGLALVADDAIPLLLGQKWVPIIMPSVILAGSGLIVTLHSLSGPPVLVKGGAGPGLRFNLLCVAVLFPSFYLGGKLGLLAVCSVWVTIYPILVVYWAVQAKRIIGYRWIEFWLALRPAVLGTIVMVAAVTAVKLSLLPGVHPAMRLSVVIPLGVVAYLAVFLRSFSRPLKELVGMFRPARGFPFKAWE